MLVTYESIFHQNLLLCCLCTAHERRTTFLSVVDCVTIYPRLCCNTRLLFLERTVHYGSLVANYISLLTASMLALKQETNRKVLYDEVGAHDASNFWAAKEVLAKSRTRFKFEASLTLS